MRRSVSIGLLACLGAAVFVDPNRAADKATKANSVLAPSKAEADAREYVHQALLAETLGDNLERGRRLDQALLAAPDLPEANWHSARIRVENVWLPLSQVVNRAQNDPNLQKYRELRDKVGTGSKAIRELARWCNKSDLPDLMRLHYAQLLGHENADADMKKEAVKQLDLREVNGAWMPAAELKAKEEQAKAVEAAIARWRPLLKKLQEQIDGDDFARRDRAIEEFHKLDDIAIIAVLETFLLDGGDRFQEEAVKRLATFPHYEATAVLVHYAVLARTSIIRDVASTALKSRPLHESVPLLLAGLTAPIKSRYQVTWGTRGQISYTHAFWREGSSANALLMTHSLATRQVTKQRIIVPRQEGEARFGTTVGTSPAEALRQQLASTSVRAANKQAEVLLANTAIGQANEKVFEALENSTGQSLAREPTKWWSWWQSYNQKYWPRQNYFAYESNAYNYYANTITMQNYHSCFLAGTPVHTELGAVPIELIKPGDRVLAQDQNTGELAYKVVLTKTLRLPTEMICVQSESTSKTQGEKIVTTLGHPFWVVGHGWKMASELKPGDLLHQLDGAIRIAAIDPAAESSAHNLVVDDFNTYFVGQAGLLVHDNEFRKPTRAIVPGLSN